MENPPPSALPDLLRRHAAALLMGLATVGGLLLVAWATKERVALDTPLTIIEPQPLWAITQFAAGEPMYRDFRVERPAVPLTYGPLAYLAPGSAARLLGLEEAKHLLRAGRAASVLGLLAALGACAAIARQRGVRWPWAIAAGAPLLWIPYMAEWHGKFAPDIPALGLSLLGLAVAGRAPSARWRLGLAILLWLAAFGFKATVIAGPLAFGIERLAAWLRDRNDADAKRELAAALAAGGILLGAAAGLAGVFQWATGGLWKLHAIDSMAACRFDFALTWDSLRGLGLGGGGLLLAAMGAWAIRRARANAFHAAFLAACAFQALLMAKEGANINYLVGAVSLWGIGAALDFDAPGGFRGSWLGAAAGAAIGLLACWAVPGSARIANEMPRLIPKRELAEGAEFIRSVPADDVLLIDGVLAAWAGLDAPWMDGYHAAILHRSGLVPFDDVIGDIAARRPRFVVAGFLHPYSYHGTPLVPEGISALLAANYRVVQQGRWVLVYERRP